ncbi:MAG: hypothetical protein AAF399_12935 [Bacteroidota bacterium]
MKQADKTARNRANHGLQPKDMTPAQRKNWERIEQSKQKKK